VSDGGLAGLLAGRGVRVGDYAGATTAAAYGDVEAEWRALDGKAALLDLRWRRSIIAEGEERAEFLQGQLSGDIVSLGSGDGAPALALSAQGRTESMLAVYNRGDTFEICVDASLLDDTGKRLEQFLVADDVEFAVCPPCDRIGVVGPGAAAVLAEVGVSLPSDEPTGGGWFYATAEIDGLAVRVLGRGDLRVPLVELVVDGDGAAVWERLERAGAVPAGTDALEVLRVESGTPRYGVDVDTSRVAIEARLEWAIHFDKGCYVGQEIVERAVSRGRLVRELCLLAPDAPVGAGDVISDRGDKDTVTSVVRSPRLGLVCLAYVPCEQAAPGTSVTIGAAAVAARVLEWPRPRELGGR